MSTGERELTSPVELCLPDGRLDPEAVGWSRVPLHTARLGRRWGRTKRWDYWAVLAGDLVVSLTFSDVDYLGIVGVWWADLSTGEEGGREVVVPLASGIHLPDRPGTEALRFRARHLRVEVEDVPGSGPPGARPVPTGGCTRIRAEWLERGGEPARLLAEVALPVGHESLNVVIPWSDRRFQLTSKHQARRAKGSLRVGRRSWSFDDAWGVLDVGRGRWPHRIRWNWGGGAGLADDGTSVVGLQLGGRWTVGTGLTENGVLVDGRLTKIGDELEWDYDWDDPMRPWRVRAPDGSVDVALLPRHDRHSRIEAGVLGMEVHQVFGEWSGSVRPDGRDTVGFTGIQGFAEEARNRW